MWLFLYFRLLFSEEHVTDKTKMPGIPQLDLSSIVTNRDKHKRQIRKDYTVVDDSGSPRSEMSVNSMGSNAFAVLNYERNQFLNQQNKVAQPVQTEEQSQSKKTTNAKPATRKQANQPVQAEVQTNANKDKNTQPDPENQIQSNQVRIKVDTRPKFLEPLPIDDLAHKLINYLSTVKMDQSTIEKINKSLQDKNIRDVETRSRLVRDTLEIIMADQLRTSALDTKNQISVSSPQAGFNPTARMPDKALPKGSSRRLHNTNVNPNIQTEKDLKENRVVFFCSFIMPENLNLKNLIGVHFYYDQTTTIYEYSGFGDNRKEIRAWPVIQRKAYNFNEDNFVPGARLVFKNLKRKLQIDHIMGYHVNRFGLDTSKVEQKPSENEPLVRV